MRWQEGAAALRGFGDKARDLQEMIDIGLLGGPLLGLMQVPPSGRLGRFQNGDPLLHGRSLSVRSR